MTALFWCPNGIGNLAGTVLWMPKPSGLCRGGNARGVRVTRGRHGWSAHSPKRRGFDCGEEHRAGRDAEFFGGRADDFCDKRFTARFEHHAFSPVRVEEFGDTAFEQVAGADGFGVLLEEDDVARGEFKQRLLAGATFRNDKVAVAPRVVEEAVFLCRAVEAEQVEVARGLVAMPVRASSSGVEMPASRPSRTTSTRSVMSCISVSECEMKRHGMPNSALTLRR